MSHAPSMNFVTAMISATMRERKAPKPLITMPLRHPGSCWRKWCLVMPACDSVNPVNTPMA